MILCDSDIGKHIAEGRIVILPEFNENDIRPTGVRMHLGKDILIPKPGQLIDPGVDAEVAYDRTSIAEGGFVLKRDAFILASTYEKVMAAPDLVAYIEGRSTVARLGVQIHCTSGIIDSIHNEPRAIVLEIKNIGVFDIVIKEHMPVAMLVFSQVSGKIRQRSQSQYQNQDSVEPPNLSFKINR